MDKLPSGTNVTVANGSVDRWSFNEHLDPAELRILVPAVLGVICVSGLACNLTAMGVLVYCAHKGKVSLINSLLFNLTLADGLVLAIAAPLRAHAAYYNSESSWRLGWSACRTADWFLQSCMAAKSLTVAVLAEASYRYVSSLGKQADIGTVSILVVLTSVWTSACAASMPHWLFTALRRDERRGGLVCAMAVVPPKARDFVLVYMKAYPLAVYCAPTGVALLCLWKACGAQRRRRSGKTPNLVRARNRSRKLTLMLLGLTVATAILWLPQWVVWVWEMRLAERELQGAHPPLHLLRPPPLLLSLSSQLLTFSLSLVNPVVVLSLSEEFREGSRELFRRIAASRKRHLPSPGPHRRHATPTFQRVPHPSPESSSHEDESDPTVRPAGNTTRTK